MVGGGVRWYCETLQDEGFGAVGVEQAGAAYAVFADEGGDAGEGDVEARGLGELRAEEAGLDLAADAGLCVEMDGEDAGGGGVGLQVEVEELEEDGAVGEGEGGFEGADVVWCGGVRAGVESEAEGEGGEGEGVGLGAEEDLVEHGAEDEEEGVEEVDGGVEGEVLFEGEDGLDGHHEVGVLAEGEPAEAFAVLAEADDEVDFGDGGEVGEGVQAPELEGGALGFGEAEGGEG